MLLENKEMEVQACAVDSCNMTRASWRGMSTNKMEWGDELCRSLGSLFTKMPKKINTCILGKKVRKYCVKELYFIPLFAENNKKFL